MSRRPICGSKSDCDEFCGREFSDLRDEILLLRERLDITKAALVELGYYGIDFGYGAYDCDVAKIAQDAIKRIGVVEND